MNHNVYFISGIDTDAGKTYATGYLAALYNSQGIRCITQKFIQTGNVGRSEDIEAHRQLMRTGLLPEDHEELTMPEIFSYPASPLLAARIDGRPIRFDRIRRATRELAARYDRVLIEGAGGLMVPLTEDLLTIDYIRREGYPVIFVTSGRLGSVSHTLLSLEAMERRGIQLAMLAYNHYPADTDPVLQDDTRRYLQTYLKSHFPNAEWTEIPLLSGADSCAENGAQGQ